MKRSIIFLTLVLVISAMSFSATIPTGLTTNDPSPISCSGFGTGSNAFSDGGSAILDKGMCWATTHNPTTSDNNWATGIKTADSYSVFISYGLSANTLYYCRTWATNAIGTAYGPEKSFTTLTLPTVTTSSITNITVTTANGGGNVTSGSGQTVTERGVCWNTTGNPTTANSKVTCGSGLGVFSCTLTGLSPSTTYHARAYAKTSSCTGYGSEVDFTTLTCPTFGMTGSYVTVSPTAVESDIPTNVTATINGDKTNMNVALANAYEYHALPEQTAFNWNGSGACWVNLYMHTAPPEYTGNGYITVQMTITKTGCPNDVKTAKIIINN